MGGRRYRTWLIGSVVLLMVIGIAGTAPAGTWRHRRHHPPTPKPAPTGQPPVTQPTATTPPEPSPTTAAPAPTVRSSQLPATGAAYQVVDGKLHDPCGAEVVLRGVNKMAVFTDRAGTSFPEIAKTGANSVRFMWFTFVSPGEATQTLQSAVDAHLIPIWELHDATGNFAKMSDIEAFWTKPETIDVLRKFESHIIVNLANEAGTDVDDGQFVNTYRRIIDKLRKAGLRMPLMVDAAGFGRNVEQLLRLAPDLLAADSRHNVMFSWHVYDAGADQPARIDRAIATAAQEKVLLLIGEFGSVSPGACQLGVPYLHVIRAAQAGGIGYLAWSWDGDNDDCKSGAHSAFDLVADGIHLSTLRPGYPSEVVLTDPASIAKTAQRTPWQVENRCA